MLFRHIDYFLVATEHGSFTRAASALYVSQPILFRQTYQLEESLGVLLFDRNGRTIRPANTGEVWRQYASWMLQELGAGKRTIYGVIDLIRGSLRIAVTPISIGYFINPLMTDFYARYPGIVLQLQETPQEKIEDLLCRDELDVGITFVPIHSSELETIPLLTGGLASVMAEHHPLAVYEQVASSRLHDEKLILLSTEFTTREQIDHYYEKTRLHPQAVIETNSISMVLELIRHTSFSTSLLAAIATQHDGPKAISLAPPLLKRAAVLLRRESSWQTAAAGALLHMALEECAGVDESESQ